MSGQWEAEVHKRSEALATAAHRIPTTNAPKGLRAYLCYWCDAWHLTKNAERNGKDLEHSLHCGPRRGVFCFAWPELRLNAEAQNLGLPLVPSGPFAHSGERAADPA